MLERDVRQAVRPYIDDCVELHKQPPRKKGVGVAAIRSLNLRNINGIYVQIKPPSCYLPHSPELPPPSNSAVGVYSYLQIAKYLATKKIGVDT